MDVFLEKIQKIPHKIIFKFFKLVFFPSYKKPEVAPNKFSFIR